MRGNDWVDIFFAATYVMGVESTQYSSNSCPDFCVMPRLPL